MQDYDIAGAQGLGLHNFYRAMAWLGEEIEEKSEDALAPRCVKDAMEEKLFAERRDLFSDLSVVFMDTTSLSFYGEGGETLGEHGYSKDYRPDLKQMILGLVVDGAGRPICTEMWPGNTADVTSGDRDVLRLGGLNGTVGSHGPRRPARAILGQMTILGGRLFRQSIGPPQMRSPRLPLCPLRRRRRGAGPGARRRASGRGDRPRRAALRAWRKNSSAVTS